MDFLEALRRMFLKNFSALWTSVTFLAFAKDCSVKFVNSSQLAFEKFMKVKCLELNFVKLAVRLIEIGRWSELSLFSILQVLVGMRLGEARLMSGAVEAVLVTLVGKSSFMIP